MSKPRFNWPPRRVPAHELLSHLEDLSKPVEPEPERKMLNFTPVTAKQFKAAYTEACKTKTKDETFIWDGSEFLVGYAKYLVEHLENQFGKL